MSPVAAGALIRDGAGRVLFVRPGYKRTLEIPGGVVEEDESPFAACRREIREELGLDMAPGRLLVVNWTPRRGVWSDSIQFVFDGGVLADEQIDQIRPIDTELTGVLLLSLDEAEPQLRPSMARRLRLAFDTLAGEQNVYADFGRHPSLDR